MKPTLRLPPPSFMETADARRVRLGAGYRLPAPAPAEVADAGRIKVGSCGRLPAHRTAS